MGSFRASPGVGSPPHRSGGNGSNLVLSKSVRIGGSSPITSRQGPLTNEPSGLSPGRSDRPRRHDPRIRNARRADPAGTFFRPTLGAPASSGACAGTSNVPTPWIVCGPTNHSIAQRSPSPSLRLVEEADLGELVADRLVGRDAVEVAALDHERPRGDQGGHLGVVERAAQVELEDLVLVGPDVTVRGSASRRSSRPIR